MCLQSLIKSARPGKAVERVGDVPGQNDANKM